MFERRIGQDVLAKEILKIIIIISYNPPITGYGWTWSYI